MRTCIVSVIIIIVEWAGLPAQALPFPADEKLDSPKIHSSLVKYSNIPPAWRGPIGKALASFPELVHTHVRFRVRHARSPLATNRDWMSFLLHFGRQAYIITISDRTIPALSPILFDSLDYGAKIGVIGHELSHVSNFSRRNVFGWLSLGLGHLSSRYLDRMEFATDSLCIAHGLGCALLDWSQFVRQTLQTHNWRGADNIMAGKPHRERYMNPKTIMARLNGPCK